jgi:hypothetical protein
VFPSSGEEKDTPRLLGPLGPVIEVSLMDVWVDQHMDGWIDGVKGG